MYESDREIDVCRIKVLKIQNEWKSKRNKKMLRISLSLFPTWYMCIGREKKREKSNMGEGLDIVENCVTEWTDHII